MPLDIAKELQNTLHEAVMQHAAKSLKQGQDWEQASAIIEGGETQRAALEETYRQDYDSRVEVVRKRLIKEAGEFDLKHPAPTGRDRFDRNAINRQAHLEVQHDHDRVLQQSRDIQSGDMMALQESALERDQAQTHAQAQAQGHTKSITKGKAKEPFNQTSDRRREPDRRAPTRSR